MSTAAQRQATWRLRLRERKIVVPVEVERDKLVELLLRTELLPPNFWMGKDDIAERAEIAIATAKLIKHVIEENEK